MQSRIQMEPVSRADAGWMYRLRTDPQVIRYVDSPRIASESAMADKLDQLRRSDAAGDSIFRKILLADGGAPIGTICLWNFNLDRSCAEFGFELFPEYQGKGYMSEALQQLLDVSRRQLGLSRVEAWTHPENLPAQRLLGRFGFSRDAEAEAAAIADGTLKGYTIYSRSLPRFVRSQMLESARLRQEPFQASDAGFILRLLNTEGWLRYIGDRGVTDEASARAYLERSPIRLERETGMTFYKVSLKESGAPVGMCGLILRDYLPGPDLGFAFLPEAEGKGYAVEAAQAWLPVARNVFGYDTLWAITVPENQRSIRLLERLGFSPQGIMEHEGEKLMRWSRGI